MSLLAPWFLAGALLAAAGVVALHFLAFQRPRAAVLPTARFLPDRPARAASPARRPRDLLLLALRLLLVILLGLAFARPVLTPRRRPVARLVVLDLSRAVGDAGAARDSARRYLAAGDALVVFDTAARAIEAAAADSALGAAAAGADTPSRRGRGSLSAALVAALRAAPALRQHADSVELVIVSPVAAEELDAATRELRALWRGRARVVRPAAVVDSTPPRRSLAVRAPAADPVLAAASLAHTLVDSAGVRVVRAVPGAADSGWARAGGVLVHWPAAGARPGWARAATDTIGAVVTAGGSIVAAFERAWRAPAGRPVAWWADGEPAATETPLGAGCVRQVAVAVPEAGDAALAPSFRRLLAALAEPCGGARDLRPLADAGWLAGAGALYAPARPAGADGRSLARWLFAGALLAALAELLARRGEGRA